MSKRIPVTKEQVESLYYNELLPVCEVASRLGYSATTNLYRVLDRFGLPRRKLKTEEEKKTNLDKYQAAYRKKNHLKRAAYSREYSEKNKEKIKARHDKYANKYVLKARAERERLRLAVFDLLGGRKCRKCGYDADIRALQIDHLNGGGYQERRIHRDRKFYRHILEVGGAGYQILCANCNWIKRYENDEVKKSFVLDPLPPREHHGRQKYFDD